MSEEVVVLKVFTNDLDAAMARDVLKDEGVTAFVFKDDSGGMEPHLQRTNGVSLMVNAADVERAQKILSTLTASWENS
jgi:nitrogen regulatory protein PII-like uncharacterized protein